MAEQDKRKFTIVGAGLGGALMAASLGRRGYAVDLFEMRPDMRKADLAGGRSINLALSLRGLHALDRVGLADEVMETAVPMRGRMMHGRDGGLTFQRYGKDDSQCINSVSRGGLNITLLNAAETYDDVNLYFQHKCIGADLDAGWIEFADQETGKTVRVDDCTIIGADGAFSVIRRQMQRRNMFNFSQDYLQVGYKELTIPAGENGEFLMEKHALHIWPRGPFMMIALPNFDATFTCTLFWPHEGPQSFAAIRSDEDVRPFFEAHFPDALPLMPTLVEDYRNNPTSPLVTVRCGPWYVADRCVLLGDACHAVVPFYGQGMIAAFEDVVALTDCIVEHGPDVGESFRAYYDIRKPHCDALAQLAIDNFTVMSSLTRSKRFLVGKKIESVLHKLFPKSYLPLYTMVTFTRMGYADAVRRYRQQKKVVASIAAGIALSLLTWIAFALT
ncbi:MAG: FAD-dependent oxidoreductase [Planctomycetota bacterium]|jgi:kynurenine 3-monooxygenase